MKLVNPLLGRAALAVTPIRMGGVTGRVGEFGMTRVESDGRPKMHRGLDLLCPVSWPVFAAHAGVVDRAGWESEANPAQGFGLRVWLTGDGVRTCYAHLSKILVERGAHVAAGDLVGLTGRTGNITEGIPTHLHFEVWAPDAVDPAPLLIDYAGVVA